MVLYRPVGIQELQLIMQADFKQFPPRLPHQPIFYPVLDLGYAEQIARDWNTKDPASGFAGFVTRFDVLDRRATCYPTHTVGANHHRELWVPAEDLDEFNRDLASNIEVIRHFVGPQFEGSLDPETHLPAPDEGVTEGSRVWSVLRLDDNGNEYVVERRLGLEEALHLAAEFEARGHKQTYWAEIDTDIGKR